MFSLGVIHLYWKIPILMNEGFQYLDFIHILIQSCSPLSLAQMQVALPCLLGSQQHATDLGNTMCERLSTLLKHSRLYLGFPWILLWPLFIFLAFILTLNLFWVGDQSSSGFVFSHICFTTLQQYLRTAHEKLFAGHRRSVRSLECCQLLFKGGNTCSCEILEMCFHVLILIWYCVTSFVHVLRM